MSRQGISLCLLFHLQSFAQNKITKKTGEKQTNKKNLAYITLSKGNFSQDSTCDTSPKAWSSAWQQAGRCMFAELHAHLSTAVTQWYVIHTQYTTQQFFIWFEGDAISLPQLTTLHINFIIINTCTQWWKDWKLLKTMMHAHNLKMWQITGVRKWPNLFLQKHTSSNVSETG